MLGNAWYGSERTLAAFAATDYNFITHTLYAAYGKYMVFSIQCFLI